MSVREILGFDVVRVNLPSELDTTALAELWRNPDMDPQSAGEGEYTLRVDADLGQFYSSIIDDAVEEGITEDDYQYDILLGQIPSVLAQDSGNVFNTIAEILVEKIKEKYPYITKAYIEYYGINDVKTYVKEKSKDARFISANKSKVTVEYDLPFVVWVGGVNLEV